MTASDVGIGEAAALAEPERPAEPVYEGEILTDIESEHIARHSAHRSKAVVRRQPGQIARRTARVAHRRAAAGSSPSAPSVCKLTVGLGGGERHGTAFRIGPDLLLTNWHVVHTVETVGGLVPR